MGRRLRRIGLMTLILGGAALGCTRSAVQHKEPPDPLLVTKKPVEGRPRGAEADPGYDNPPPPPAVPAVGTSGVPWPTPTDR
jgi:hypothetical protein